MYSSDPRPLVSFTLYTLTGDVTSNAHVCDSVVHLFVSFSTAPSLNQLYSPSCGVPPSIDVSRSVQFGLRCSGSGFVCNAVPIQLLQSTTSQHNTTQQHTEREDSPINTSRIPHARSTNSSGNVYLSSMKRDGSYVAYCSSVTYL